MKKLCLSLILFLSATLISIPAHAASNENSFVDQLTAFAAIHTQDETRSYFQRYRDGMIRQLVTCAKEVQSGIEALNAGVSEGARSELELIRALNNYYKLEGLLKKISLDPAMIAGFEVSTRQEAGAARIWDTEIKFNIGAGETRTEKLKDTTFRTLQNMKLLKPRSGVSSDGDLAQYDLKPFQS